MAIVTESIFRFTWHCSVITPKAELTDRLWGIVIRSGVEIMVVLSYPQRVSSIRSSGGRFSSWWGVHIRDINLLGIGLETGTLVRVMAWLFSRVFSCTRAARALRLPRNLLTYWLLPWGNTRGGSAILPRTWFGIWGPRLLGRPAVWWGVGRHGALVGRLTRGLGSTPTMIHMGGGLAMPKRQLDVSHKLICGCPGQMNSIRKQITIIYIAVLQIERRVIIYKLNGMVPAEDTQCCIESINPFLDLRWPRAWTDAWYTHWRSNFFSRGDKIGIFIHKVIDFYSLLITVITIISTNH